MRHLYFYLVVLISFQVIPAQVDSNFHIYIALGQSNMVGAYNAYSEDLYTNPRFKIIQPVDCPEFEHLNLSRYKGEIHFALPGIFHCDKRYSPMISFANTMMDSLPEEISIGIIPVGLPGAKIQLFDKDEYIHHINDTNYSWWVETKEMYNNNPYERIIELSKIGLNHGMIKGILLHQGESNSGDANWPTQVSKIYEHILGDLGLMSHDLPILVGELVHADMGGEAGSIHNPIIHLLPTLIAHSYIIPSDSLAHNGDQIHFNREASKELGKRYALQMLNILKNPIERPLEDSILDTLSDTLINTPSDTSSDTSSDTLSVSLSDTLSDTLLDTTQGDSQPIQITSIHMSHHETFSSDNVNFKKQVKLSPDFKYLSLPAGDYKITIFSSTGQLVKTKYIRLDKAKTIEVEDNSHSYSYLFIQDFKKGKQLSIVPPRLP